jgi:molecular chaperone HtpG
MAQSETAQPQTFSFQAEIQQLLNLVIHSLYSHKEIFLRELVSNASDALDKLRFRAVTEPELLGDQPALEVRIHADKAKGTLTIEDTGIGMTHDELVKNLGTIAHSGSREFIEMLSARGQKDVNLIGQFGVGFYSGYLVADRVEVHSKAAGAKEGFVWSSEAKGSFTVNPSERTERGTAVVLHLKEDQKEFLDEWRLRDLIGRYSDYVNHPIKLAVERAAPKAEGATDAAEPVMESKLEVVNKASALWQRAKSDITDEQYEEFYKHLTHDFSPPLARTHFTAEGSTQFTGLLFIPKSPPFDLNSQEKKGIRLFVKRVFIMDNAQELLPNWLRFVRGVVDSDDLPLNVSREMLQDSNIVRTIRKQLVKKVLDLLDKVAKEKPEDYRTFWEGFGTTLKEGLAMDNEYREKLGGLLRYDSSREEGLTSLSEYVSRMKEGQEAIYYAFGESKTAVASSPYLEGMKKRGYEVLFMTDPVDDWTAQGLREFEGKKLVSVMHADLKLDAGTDEDKKKNEERSGELKGLLTRMKDILKDHVREVRTSERLTDSPCVLVLPEGGSHAYLERLIRERGKAVPHMKRILELNPSHPLVETLRLLHERAPDSPKVSEWTEMLYDQALLTEGGHLEDPNRFARRVTELLTKAASAELS